MTPDEVKARFRAILASVLAAEPPRTEPTLDLRRTTPVHAPYISTWGSTEQAARGRKRGHDAAAKKTGTG